MEIMMWKGANLEYVRYSMGCMRRESERAGQIY